MEVFGAESRGRCQAARVCAVVGGGASAWYNAQLAMSLATKLLPKDEARAKARFGDLYRAFAEHALAGYPSGACAHCVSEAEFAKLEQNVTSLDARSLTPFFHAVWEGSADFMHFAPRLLELLSR